MLPAGCRSSVVAARCSALVLHLKARKIASIAMYELKAALWGNLQRKDPYLIHQLLNNVLLPSGAGQTANWTVG